MKWFTRNAKDYTDRYGAVLTPQILEGVSAHKCVLDGEVRGANRINTFSCPLACFCCQHLFSSTYVYGLSNTPLCVKRVGYNFFLSFSQSLCAASWGRDIQYCSTNLPDLR